MPVLMLALVAAMAGCNEPRGPAFEPSPETLALPRPGMVETAGLRARRDAAAPDALRLEAAADALAGRGAALRERAEALAGPVVDPARRARIEAARERAAPRPP